MRHHVIIYTAFFPPQLLWLFTYVLRSVILHLTVYFSKPEQLSIHYL